MAEGQRPKRKALHRGIADAINRDASATSLLLNKVQPRPLRTQSMQEPGEIIAPGAAIALSENIAPSATKIPDRVKPALGAAIAPGALLALILNPQQHTRVPNDLLDKVLGELLPSDQLILLRLYRLTWGYHKDSITVSYDTLGKACNLSRRAAIDSVKRLEREGLVERIGVENKTKGNVNRGVTIRMLVPSAIIAPGAKSAPNKEKLLKETIKGEVASLDTTKCPDCDGMGVRYIDPLDYSKGTVKCRHERLTEGK